MVIRKKESITNPESESSPPLLTDAYHKARRSYGLFSGLLVAWELIGVEIKEAPVQNFNIVFKAPEAAPYVLIALILYFAFRTSVEWYQSDTRRREMKVSVVDFIVAHVIAIAAIALYLIQRILDLQVVTYVTNQITVNAATIAVAMFAAASFFLGNTITRVLRMLWSYLKWGIKRFNAYPIILMAAMACIVAIGAWSYGTGAGLIVAWSAGAGIIFAILVQQIEFGVRMRLWSWLNYLFFFRRANDRL